MPDDDKTTDVGRDADGGPLSLIVSGAAGVTTVTLARDRDYVLGRTSDAAIVIDDPSVSRRHALLRTADLTLEDLESTNGTRIRGVTLRPGQQAQIDVGTVIELGNATLLLQRAPVPTALPSAHATNRPPPPPRGGDDEPIVRAPNMVSLYQTLDVIAPNDMTVVVLGESGVGKEVFVQELHRRSLRSREPCLRLNCASFAESVLEAELFGYERGAFTSAVQARPGLFESANGGTVFLDEIGEMPLGMQAKLLRVLENGEVLRIGSREPKIVNVRFVAATHRDLRFLIASGGFRHDLYFRLNGFTVVVPPLRERKEEIPALAERFLGLAAAKARRSVPLLGDEARGLLAEYAWPGNVRELRTFVERALAFCRGRVITREDLIKAAPELAAPSDATGAVLPDTTGQMAPIDVTRVTRPPEGPDTLRFMRTVSAAPPVGSGLKGERASFERERILATLAKTAGNQKRAAEELGVSRRTLVNKLEQYGIERPRKG